MRYLKEWPRFLLTLPRKGRFVLLILCFMLFVGLHLLTFPDSHNGSLLVIPISLTAWIFGKRGLFVCLLAEIVALVVYQSIRFKSLWWPVSFALFFWGGILVLVFIGATIVTVRRMVDSAEAARRKAEQAEQETAMAYAKQLQLNQLKDHFMIHVSHELRTPLTILGVSLELLKAQDEMPDQTTELDLLTEAIASHEHLIDVVNRILEASAIGEELPSLHYEAIALHRVVLEVLGSLNPAKTRAYMIRLQIAEQVMVWADPQYLRQVIGHLLSNVFKYVPEQTAVTIEASHSAPSSPVCLSVQDAGPGIPADEQLLLFEKCMRLKRDLAGPTPGMGLGLFICKHLVEAMGGRIWVESSGRQGEGSRFCFTLLSLPSLPLPLVFPETESSSGSLVRGSFAVSDESERKREKKSIRKFVLNIRNG